MFASIDRHDITEILLKVALNTINLNLHLTWFSNKKNPEKPIINFDGCLQMDDYSSIT
jgi:hypothetical protein